MGEPQEPREAWSEVGRRFEELGRSLREHFASPGAEAAPAAGSAGPADPGDADPGGERERAESDSRAAVLDAVRRVGDAAQRLGDQAGEAVRSPEVRETAQRATRSLADALEATFGQLSGQLRARTGGAGGSGGGGSDWSGGSGGSDAGSPAAGPADPEAIPGPHPDPEPGEDPVAGGAPTRPPSDS